MLKDGDKKVFPPLSLLCIFTCTIPYFSVGIPVSEVWCVDETQRNLLWPGARIDTVSQVKGKDSDPNDGL